jgi:anaerobic magnesium-protoporphyrin IX monomethyl ester cyclase
MREQVLDVLFVGAESQENLGIRYLVAVLRQQGYAAEIAPFEGPRDAPAVLAAVTEKQPRLVGLSVIFQFSAGDFLALAASLRAAGYAGLIALGGHFPSFEYEPLLQDEPALDLVVRFEGEETMLDLMRQLDRPAVWDDIPGLAFRRERAVVATPPRPLLADLDRLPFPARDGGVKEHLGVRFAALLGSRGCFHNCAFCSIGAFYHRPGGPPQRMRSVANLMEEMQQLHDDWGVDLYIFNDDEFFDLRPDCRQAQIEQLLAELSRRHLHPKLFVKCRASDVDPATFARLRDAGLVRAYVGIESGASHSLEVFGKRTTVAENRAAVATLKRLGILADFNLLMFNPYTTLADVEDDLQFVEDMAADGSVPVSIARVEVYSGTPLQGRLGREGRLQGNYRAWDYHIAEPAAELLFRQVLAAMQRRNYHPEGLSKTAIQAYYELLIYRHFYPENYDERLARDLAAIVAKLNRHSVALIRRLAGWARRGDIFDQAEVNKLTIAAALETGRIDAELEARLWRWRQRLHRRVAGLRRPAGAAS